MTLSDKAAYDGSTDDDAATGEPCLPDPYYADESVTLYLGDCREIVPALPMAIDAVVTDPPYGETSLQWDTWPKGWPALIAEVARSMWMFGSARMFDTYRDEILSAWHMSQDLIWSKGRGVGTVNDRFFRTHEHIRHYYRGPWGDVYRESPRVKVHGAPVGETTRRPAEAKSWHGWRNATTYTDDGTRLVHSVIPVPGLYRHGGHPTQKPVGILEPLIRYACPPGGVVLDPFAGSGSTADAARSIGRHAVLIEGHEPYAERIAARLAQDVLPIEGTAS